MNPPLEVNEWNQKDTASTWPNFHNRNTAAIFSGVNYPTGHLYVIHLWSSDCISKIVPQSKERRTDRNAYTLWNRGWQLLRTFTQTIQIYASLWQSMSTWLAKFNHLFLFACKSKARFSRNYIIVMSTNYQSNIPNSLFLKAILRDVQICKVSYLSWLIIPLSHNLSGFTTSLVKENLKI